MHFEEQLSTQAHRKAGITILLPSLQINGTVSMMSLLMKSALRRLRKMDTEVRTRQVRLSSSFKNTKMLIFSFMKRSRQAANTIEMSLKFSTISLSPSKKRS